MREVIGSNDLSPCVESIPGRAPCGTKRKSIEIATSTPSGSNASSVITSANNT